jgi:hypothetical protein
MTKFLHMNVVLPVGTGLKARKLLQSRTVAVNSLTSQQVMVLAQDFLNLASGPQTVNLDIGVTFCSLKDKYSRKEGRTQALKRMSSATLEVTGVNVTETHIFVVLKEYRGITLALRLNKKSGFSCVVGSLTVGQNIGG